MPSTLNKLPESSSFAEDLQQASVQKNSEEAELRRAQEIAELERMYALEEKKNQDRHQRVEQIKSAAKEVAKKKAKDVLVKQGERMAARGLASVAASSFPVWGPILGVILAVLGSIALIIVVVVSVQSYCQEGGVKGYTVKAASKAAGFLGYADLCKEMNFENVQIASNAANTSFAQPNDPTALTDADARTLLASAGIPVNAFEPQTSLKGIKRMVLAEIISLANACSTLPDKNTCKVIVTGGTELTGGHAAGPCSHLSGNKIDIDDNVEINNYIYSKFTRSGTRSDGAALYTSPGGVVYALESTHWDIVVGC